MPTEVKSTYTGDLRVKNIHSGSGSEIETDAPLDNMGKGLKFSPTDLLVTALASCIMTTMAIVAERDGLSLEGLSCRTEKHMSEGKPRMVSKIVLEFTMPKSLTAEQREKLERFATNCPVHHSLASEVERVISFL